MDCARGDRAGWTEPGHHLIGWHDADYPPLLRRIRSPPAALFVAGDPGLLWRPAVAVVGSRSPTAGGVRQRPRFRPRAGAAGLGGHQRAGGRASMPPRTSRGVERRRHRRGARHRPDIAYPRGIRAAERVAGAGAVISEHPPGTEAAASISPAATASSPG